MLNRDSNSWRALPALFMLLYIVPPKAFSVPVDQAGFDLQQTHPSLQHKLTGDQAAQLPKLDQEQIRLDPTRPSSFLFDPLLDNGLVEDDGADAANSLTLTAIFIAKERKLAVVNGTIVKEGESIAGRQVKEISAHAVKLQEPKGILELRLPSFRLKKEAAS